MEAGKALAPVPITLGSPARAGLSKLFPNQVSPPMTGTIGRQVLSSFGIKSEMGKSPAQQVGQLAREFVENEGLSKQTGWKQVQTDEASYSKLRTAMRNQDGPAIKEQYEALLANHKPGEIIKAMAMWAHRPFTGSRLAEGVFRRSLNDKQQDLYTQAQQERMEMLSTFHEFLMQ
jgi:hypothetical protein